MRFLPIRHIAVALALASSGQDPASAASLINSTIEIDTRGAVHEAFARPIVFDPRPTVVLNRAPYEPLRELVPDRRPSGNSTQWIPGYWSWDDDRSDYTWISGVWRVPPPSHRWISGYWAHAGSGGHRWVPGFWMNRNAEKITYLPAPPGSRERGPDQPLAKGRVWVPGTWVWQNDRYAWRPGHSAPARKDWVWIPDSTVWTPRGYVTTAGYWDRPVQRRGMMFAPMRFAKQYDSSYEYTPQVVIGSSALNQHLFARPRNYHYYFGDYYDSQYSRQGIYPSFQAQRENQVYDPIFVESRLDHETDLAWYDSRESQYRERIQYRDRRPLRTFREQETYEQSHSGSNVVAGVMLGGLLAALVSQGNGSDFETLSSQQAQTIETQNRELAAFREQRVNQEAAPATAEQTSTLTIPATAQAETNITVAEPPPAPEAPMANPSIEPSPMAVEPEAAAVVTPEASAAPSPEPVAEPSAAAVETPEEPAAPSPEPVAEPSAAAVETPEEPVAPSPEPEAEPSAAAVETPEEPVAPSPEPEAEPSAAAVEEPSVEESAVEAPPQPTVAPSVIPAVEPSLEPIAPDVADDEQGAVPETSASPSGEDPGVPVPDP